VTLSADTGQDLPCWRSILSLYGHTGAKRLILEIRASQMRATSLSLVDRWITGVRAWGTEPESDGEG
jgi:hypothetical protein